MTRVSIDRQLVWLGWTMLLIVVCGSATDISPRKKQLRRERRRKLISVSGLDEIIHHAGKMQLQELAGAIAEENNNMGETTKSPEKASPKMRIDHPLNLAPTRARSIIRRNFRYQTNPDAKISDVYFHPAPPTELITASPSPGDNTINTPNPTRATNNNPRTSNPTLATNAPVETISPTISVTSSPSDSPSRITESPTRSDTAVLSYQETIGFCNGSGPGIGCANEEPNSEIPSGNPNDIVNCYDVGAFGVEIPFGFDSIRFWIGESIVVPPDLQLNIWIADDFGAPNPRRLLYSQPLFGYTLGENTFDIDFGGMIFQQNICIGVTSVSINAGLRIQTDPAGLGVSSYIRSPACSVNQFTSLQEVGLTNDFCIEAMVSFGDALRRQ